MISPCSARGGRDRRRRLDILTERTVYFAFWLCLAAVLPFRRAASRIPVNFLGRAVRTDVARSVPAGAPGPRAPAPAAALALSLLLLTYESPGWVMKYKNVFADQSTRSDRNQK